MKKHIKYFVPAIILILFSSPLGYIMLNIVYANKNLSGEFNCLLNGFIHSFMLIGALIFSVGLIRMFVEKEHK